eukprot:207980_1
MFSLSKLVRHNACKINAIGLHRAFSSISSPLSQTDIDSFRNEGFVGVENFFDKDEFRAIRAGLSKLYNIGRFANVATEGDGTHTQIYQNLQLCPLSPELAIFKSLPFNKKICSALSQVLHDDSDNNDKIGDQDICVYLSQSFWKPAKRGLATGWHQDNAYFLLNKPQFSTALWIPIHKATKANGTIQVVKGYAKANDENGTPLEHLRDSGSDHHVTCKSSIMDDEIIDIELDECGVALFNGNVPHATGPNPTDSHRAAVAFHFVNMKHFKERQFPLPENVEYVTPIICGPNCTDGQREYGYKIGEEQWINDMDQILKEEEDILQECIYQQTAREVKQDRQTKEV